MIQIDMDMPENCGECRFADSDYGFCHAMPKEFCGYTDENGKPDWCPLRQVVTCGECRYNPKIATGDDYGECICVCEDSYYSIEPKDEWFCWKGKKKAERNNPPSP